MLVRVLAGDLPLSARVLAVLVGTGEVKFPYRSDVFFRSFSALARQQGQLFAKEITSRGMENVLFCLVSSGYLNWSGDAYQIVAAPATRLVRAMQRVAPETTKKLLAGGPAFLQAIEEHLQRKRQWQRQKPVRPLSSTG